MHADAVVSPDATDKRTITCRWCGKRGRGPGIFRHHLSNCEQNPAWQQMRREQGLPLTRRKPRRSRAERAAAPSTSRAANRAMPILDEWRREELRAEYKWLIDGLRGICDEVRTVFKDQDNTLVIAALWNVPDSKVPQGFPLKCQEFRRVGGVWVNEPIDEEGVAGYWKDARWVTYSLNKQIERGLLTRADVIAGIAKKRPKIAA